MGLLDDAIREHLDLKRRRGADPADIERAEQEALGPVRRDPIASDEGPGIGVSGGGGSEAAASAAETEPPAEHPSPPYGGAERLDDQLADERALGEEEWDDYYEDEYDEEEELDPGGAASSPASSPQPHPAPPSVPSDPDETLGDTVSYDAEPEPAQPDQQQEDVLEETPEFLQDTPDHDRLWFEQRPPRDFDFDE